MNVLVKGTNWLGDAVMSLPAIRAVGCVAPGARVSVLTRPHLADLYRALPDVSVVPETDGPVRTARTLRAAGFDLAIVLPRSFRSALAPFLARIPRRIGYAAEARSWMLTDRLPRSPESLRRHRVHYYYELLRPLGAPPPVEAPRLDVPPDAQVEAERLLPAGGPFAAIHPGAAYGEAKRWYPDRFVELGRRMARDRGLTPIVLGSPAEAPEAERIAAEIGAPAVSLAGRTALLMLAGILRRCRLLVTNDTGPMHVAAAVGTPTVAIFGPTDPAVTAPFSGPHAIVRRPLPCSPCLERVCPLGHHRCMKELAVEEVLAAAEPWLARS